MLLLCMAGGCSMFSVVKFYLSNHSSSVIVGCLMVVAIVCCHV